MAAAIAKRVKFMIKPLLVLAALGAVAAAVGLTWSWWLPPLRERILAVTSPVDDHGHGAAGQPDDHGDGGHDDHAGHDDHDLDPDVLEVSPAAQKSQGIRVEPLRRSDYGRSLPIPGVVAPIHGVTYQDVITKTSGEVTRIFALEGQIVKAGAPLFEISLTHQEAIQHQIDLLEALAQVEVANAEIARLEQLERSNPGGLAGAKLLQQRYELRHLQHTVESRRQILGLLGLSQHDVDQLIDRHRRPHSETTDADPAGHGVSPLIDTVVIHAPPAEDPSVGGPLLFVVENLAVRQGQHVDVGVTLCRLGEYRRLYIEGQAYQRDLDAVRQAMVERWGVAAVLPSAIDGSRTLENLPIVYIDSAIDLETRATRFFVELDNTLATPPESMERPFADWRFRVGQRLELRVPTERFRQKLVVPAEAVAQDGLENYVFQVSGDRFVRRPVQIEYRDENRVVLAEGQSVAEGVRIAMSGAYQLQLALLNRAAGPQEHQHHH
ncbi:MAG: efflux RND transporter periplasmic adaptor subunit [Pirellulaceae bacterium]